MMFHLSDYKLAAGVAKA